VLDAHFALPRILEGNVVIGEEVYSCFPHSIQ
jgi:hypothetical protein